MLTFDKIRELERNERESKKLQKLPDDLMDQLRDYLRRKERLQEKSSNDLLELENVRNTIKRFFELREHKILLSVLDTVKTGMPPESMAKPEETIFYALVQDLKDYREQFFKDLQKEVEVRKENNKEDNKEEKNEQMEPTFRIKKTLPEFVGPDMKTYKLSENDVVTLPKQLEELLLKEGIIEKIS